MRRFLIAVAIVWAVVPPVPLTAQVGSVTFTSCTGRQGSVLRCTWAWTSSAGGAVSANAKVVPYGRVIRFDTDPDAGALAPDDNYDATLVDTSGVDVLQGQGANRDTANVESVLFSVPMWHDGQRTLDLAIASAGAANSGVLVVWISQQQ